METEVVREVQSQCAGNVERVRTQLLKGHREVSGKVWQYLEVEESWVEPGWCGEHEDEQEDDDNNIENHQSQDESGAVVVT